MQQFRSLSYRLAHGIAATIPPFSPATGAPEEPQRQAYEFLCSIARRLAEEPALAGLPATPDGAFGDWELFKQKPELIDEMRRQMRKLDDFYGMLLQLGDAATVEGGKLSVEKTTMKVSSKVLKALEALGLASDNRKDRLLLWSTEHPQLADGWKLLSAAAKASDNPGFLFSRAVFNPADAKAVEVFRALAVDRNAFGLLETYFNGSGYRLAELREGMSVDWVKSYGKKEEPLKAHWAERTHGGLSIVYDYRRANPVVYGLRLPMFRELLGRFDEMEEDVKALVVARTKKCDGCGYCTQTDKTGKRPRQIVTVQHGGQEYDLCTLFPGFSFIWTKVDETEAKRMIGLLEFTDRVFTQKDQPTARKR